MYTRRRKKAVNRFHCLRIEMSCPPLSRLRPDATGLAITRISVPFAFHEFFLVFSPSLPPLFFFFFSCIWKSVPHRPVWKEGFVTRDKLTVRSDEGRYTLEVLHPNLGARRFVTTTYGVSFFSPYDSMMKTNFFGDWK